MAKRLYVGNLSTKLTALELQRLFEQFGNVRAVSIIEDRATGRSKGFGFVEMSSEEEARAAIEGLNTADVAGHPIVVNATPELVSRGESGGSNSGSGRYIDVSADSIETPTPEAVELVRDYRTLQVDLFLGDTDISENDERIAALRTLVRDALDAMGFELDPETQIQEEFGSWWARFLFRSKQALTSDQMIDIYTETREAIRRKTIDGVGADVFSKRANAIVKLLAQLDKFDEVAFRLGDVLVIKATMAGKVRVVVETMSHQVQRMLDDDPLLLRDPVLLLTYVKSPILGPPQIAQSQETRKP